MDRIFIKLLNMSFAAGVLVLAVLALRLLLKKAPKWIACVLWALVALRLLLPVGISSPLSVFNALGTQSNGSVEYFQAAGGSEKPLVRFDTIRVEGPADPAETILQLPGTALAVERHSTTRYLPPLELIWILGAAAMLLYMLWSYALLRSRIGASIPLEDRVVISDGIDAPFILGLFRPRIFLPSTLTDPQLSHVLAHERAHLARRDHWWKPLGFALLAVHWFNPLLWLAYVLLCRDIELACDEKVLKTMDPTSRPDYSQALLDLSRPRQLAACPLAFGETGVRQRVKTALRYKKPALWLTLAAIAVCTVAAVSFLTNPVKSYGEKLSAGEWGWLRESLLEEGGPFSYLTKVDVLYDREGTARYLFACYEDANKYVILDRKDGSLVDRGEDNPYAQYMTAPKFYEARPRAFLIRGSDTGFAPHVPEDEFYELRAKLPDGKIGAKARRIADAQKRYSGLPLVTVSCGDQSVEAFAALRWSPGHSEDPDGAPLVDQIRAHTFTPLLRSGRIILSLLPNAYLTESRTQVFDADLEPIAGLEDGYGFDFVQNLGPGSYYCAVEVRTDRGSGPACYDCVFLLEVPEIEAQDIPTGSLLTVNSGDQSVKAFEAFRWSEAGGLSADGEPLESQIRDHENDIPTLLLSGPVTVTPREDARVVDGVLKVFDMSLLPVIEYPEGEGLACLQTLSPGEYWCAVVVEVAHDGSASGYDCVFRLEVPATPVSAGAENVPEDILKTLREPPLGVDPEIMATYPVVVTDTEMNIYNMSLWDDFYAKTQAGEPADVTIALYTGYQQVLLYFIRYDGSSYLLVQDNTRLPATNVGSPDYDTDVYANLQVLPREGHQIALLSDRLYASYEEYRESLSVELEHWPQAVMMWKETAQ